MPALATTGYSTGAPQSSTGIVSRGEASNDNGPSLSKLEQQFRDFAGSKRQEIEEMREARHYYHGAQLTEDVLKVLKKRRQPPITANRVARKVNGIVGLVERLRQDPKAYPRTPNQEDGAELGTATINYALDDAEWTMHSSEAALTCGINGIAGVELEIKDDGRGGYNVGFIQIDPDTYFYDPRSFRPDFTDKRFEGVAKWVDLEEAQDMFPDHAEELESLIETSGPLESWQQQDREHRWIDMAAKRVFIVEHWYKSKGEWHFCIYTRGLKLVHGQSYLRDENGKTVSKYIVFSAAVDHDGDRYGLIRNMKSAQDEINARRSKMLHAANTRQIIYSEDALGEKDIERVRTEVARPDGVIRLSSNPNARFEIDKNTIDVQHQAILLQQNYEEIENIGPNPALIGQGIENKSGRAIALLQQAGMAELGPFMANLRAWKLRVYRTVWNAIQQFWTAEMWIRVTDDEGLAEFIQLNGLGTDQYGRPTMINALGELDVDIILDEGPDHVSLMEDVFETLSSLARNGAPIPPDVIIEASSLPSSTKKPILDRMRNQEPSPEEQKAQALQMAGAEAQVRKTQSEAAKNMASVKTAEADAIEKMARAVLTDAQTDHQEMETDLLPAERLMPQKQTASVSV